MNGTGSSPTQDLGALLGTYSRIVATALEGVQEANVRIREALLDGDLDYAEQLAETIETNVNALRRTFLL